MNPKIDEYLEINTAWRKEMIELRRIILECGLVEEYKWKQPCYTFNGKNVVLIHGFKDYCAIMFFKGVLLKDPKGMLIQQTENVQATRQIRFTSPKQVIALESTLKNYIFEAVEIERAGLEVTLKKTEQFNIPEELLSVFKENPEYKKAFDLLTPGRQRGYLLHFSQPKQSGTRLSRIENAAHRIYLGKGINDCVCGKSKRMPRCDGSHKNVC